MDASLLAEIAVNGLVVRKTARVGINEPAEQVGIHNPGQADEVLTHHLLAFSLVVTFSVSWRDL